MHKQMLALTLDGYCNQKRNGWVWQKKNVPDHVDHNTLTVSWKKKQKKKQKKTKKKTRNGIVLFIKALLIGLFE